MAQLTDAYDISRIWMEGVKDQLLENEDYLSEPQEFDRIQEHFTNQIREQTDEFPIWCCIENGELIGWSALRPLLPTPNQQLRNSMAISSTYVSKKGRGKGVGSYLIKQVVSKAKESQVKYVIGLQLASNEGSKKICQRNGFSFIGTLPEREDIPVFDVIAHSLSQDGNQA